MGSHGRRAVRLIDTPCFGRPVELWRRKRMWRCLELACPGGILTEQDALARPRALLSRRACWWAIGQLRRENVSVLGLGERRQELRGFADFLAGTVSALARAERDTIPDPMQEVRSKLRLDIFKQRFVVSHTFHSVAVPSAVVYDVLRHEYVPIQLRPGR